VSDFSRRDFLKTSGALIVGFSGLVSDVRGAFAQGPFDTRASHVDPNRLDSWIAVAADGSVTAWGSLAGTAFLNPNPPFVVSNAVSVGAGINFAMALKSDGRVVMWGSPVTLVTNVPASLTNAMAIACNGGDQSIGYALALRSNGIVTGWGPSVITNIPPGLSNVIAIAAGSSQGVALVSDGSPIITRAPIGGTAFSGNQFTLNATVSSPTPVTYA